MAYRSLIDSLKQAIASENTDLARNIKTVILSNYKGKSVEDEVNAIYGVPKKVSGKKYKIANFTVDDFSPEKKKVIPTPTIQVVAEDKESPNSRMGNMYKSIMEQSDDQIKLKFANDIDVAIDFLNSIRSDMDLTLIEEGQFKTFSKKFFDTFRATISTRIA